MLKCESFKGYSILFFHFKGLLFGSSYVSHFVSLPYQTAERKEKTIKELRYQLSGKQQQEGDGISQKQNFWETSCFKIMVSMSMLVLVVFSRR